MLSIRRLAADRHCKHLATPDISGAIPDFVTSPDLPPIVDHHQQFDSLSSRTCIPASDVDYEMQPLSDHSEIRVIRHKRSSHTDHSDDGPPKLSLNLAVTRQQSFAFERDFRSPPTAVNSTSPIALPSETYSRPSYFSRCPMTKDFTWLEDWATKS